MKKTYIAPATNIHQLRVESMLAAASPVIFRRTRFGNTDEMKAGYHIEDGEQSPYPDEWQDNIDAVEGDKWGTI